MTDRHDQELAWVEQWSLSFFWALEPCGLIVHLECGDGKLIACLRDNERYIVQGLGRDAGKVEHARQYIDTEQQPCARFEESAPLVEMVLLGNVSLRAPKPFVGVEIRGV